jgi:mono/diheme cytochrome c family protein
MLKRILITATAATLAIGISCAAQSDKATSNSSQKVVIPVTKTSAADGKQMFVSYCSPCHGADGRGHGPVSQALKIPPADLTQLTIANKGKFPDQHIVSILQFGGPIPSHGTAEMPVWGPILGQMNQGSAQAKQQRISNISRYLETIQVK